MSEGPLPAEAPEPDRRRPIAAVARAAAESAVPYARSVIALDEDQYASVVRAVELLFRSAHSQRYGQLVGAGIDRVAARDPGNFGVPMGYDFHLMDAGPRLIEINTNAGGMLLNGRHSASLCDPRLLGGRCSQLVTVDLLEERIVGAFRAEFAAARGGEVPLRAVAIVDDDPGKQFLRAEFELYRELFSRAGIRAFIADTAELSPGPAGGLELCGSPIDLVYLRDTDFSLATPRTEALREAYLAGTVVVTPTPREHHLLADKRRLALFCSREVLLGLGVASDDAKFLAELVPETRLLADLGLEEAWRTRREWVFKPAAAFGSKAVYRGDKISRRRLEAVHRAGGFVAQRRVAPGAIQVATDDGPRPMKFDVRAYAYRDRVLLLGGRVYQGQVTNFRSPGGGFSAICVASCPEPER